MEKYLICSYSAANQYPLKLLRIQYLRNEKIMPLHLQLSPTNRCNRNCSFCSCREMDGTQELEVESIRRIMTLAKNCGCLAVTITGGGEPLLHPQIEEIVRICYDLDIKIGLVTNGYFLEQHENLIAKCTWIRISLSDEMDETLLENLKPLVKGNTTDWAFSYVIGENPRMDLITKAIKIANEYRLTHIRLVLDLLSAYRIPEKMDRIHGILRNEKIEDSKIIYQTRSIYTSGVKDCWISLLKPVVAADGWIYPCCGVQYADREPPRKFPEHMRMMKAENVDELFETQRAYDGRQCYRCYYSDYNEFLSLRFKNLNHIEFV